MVKGRASVTMAATSAGQEAGGKLVLITCKQTNKPRLHVYVLRLVGLVRGVGAKSAPACSVGRPLASRRRTC